MTLQPPTSAKATQAATTAAAARFKTAPSS